MPLVFVPLCWWIDKKGERYFGVLYMHVYFMFHMHVYLSLYFMFNIHVHLSLLSFTIGIKSIFCWYQEQHFCRNIFILKLVSRPCLFHWYQWSCLFHFLILCTFMHIYIEHSFHIFTFIAMHELRGSFYEA